eukprot:4550905-Prymnesium_polylepis.1
MRPTRAVRPPSWPSVAMCRSPWPTSPPSCDWESRCGCGVAQATQCTQPSCAASSETRRGAEALEDASHTRSAPPCPVVARRSRLPGERAIATAPSRSCTETSRLKQQLSHTRSAPSWPSVAMRAPSDKKATERTPLSPPRWAVRRGCRPRGAPCAWSRACLVARPPPPATPSPRAQR